jgi:hypothetical protein
MVGESPPYIRNEYLRYVNIALHNLSGKVREIPGTRDYCAMLVGYVVFIFDSQKTIRVYPYPTNEFR